MKLAVGTIIVTLCFMAVAVWGDISIRHRAEKLANECAVLIELAKTGDLTAADVQYVIVEEYWRESEEQWIFYVCHNNLLDVQQALVRVKYALDEGDASYLRLASALLENEIHDIPNMELIRIESIF